MKNSSKTSEILKILVLLVCAGIWAAGCSDNSTNSGNGNGGNGNGGGGTEEPPPATFNGTINPGGTYSYTFENEGETEYYCTFHTGMQGTVAVSSDAESAESDTVIIEDMQFVPSSITIAPGTQVVWINQDAVTHSATSGNPSSDSGGGY